MDTSAVPFKSVRAAIEEAGMSASPRDRFAIAVWHDSMSSAHYFRQLRPWQIVNRIPNMHLLCRKVPFTYLIRRVSRHFPSLYDF
jgi:hypothetical protein